MPTLNRATRKNKLDKKLARDLKKRNGEPIGRKKEENKTSLIKEEEGTALAVPGATSLPSESQKYEQKEELTALLRRILQERPEKPPTYSELIKAIDKIAELQGLYPDKNKEEKHLHIHTADLETIDAGSIRKRLAMLEKR